MVSLIISDLRKTFFVSAKLLCPKGRSINKKALAGISIELNSGLYGLLGPNGAGKTTILKSLIRQLKPLAGVIVLEGQKTDEMSGRDFARKLSVVLTERVRPEMMTC